MQRILVAVDDSPAGLAAARVAVGLAAQLGASLRVVHVVADGDITAVLEASGDAELGKRRTAPTAALLRHVQGLASAADVTAETVELFGDTARLILEQARISMADLIVIGRGLDREVGRPYVGHETRIVLEFADQPVLVVPAHRPAFVNGTEGPP